MKINCLSAVDQTIKDYFSIPVYRNILDMLNTFDIVLKKYNNTVNNEFYKAINNYQRERRLDYSPLIRIPSTITGHAISKVGQTTPSIDAVFKYTNKLLKVLGVKESVINIVHMKGHVLDAIKTPTININELVNLSRNLEHEFNRVRLPIPHNFRQILNKLAAPLPTSNPSTGQPVLTVWEKLITLSKLKKAIVIMRGAVRNEIDAANIAAKVQEETLRLENEELLTREQAEAAAAIKLEQLNIERETRINNELTETVNVQQELDILRVELQAAIELLNEKAEADEENVNIIADKVNIENKLEDINVLSGDLLVYEQTLLKASDNKQIPIIPELRLDIEKQTLELEKTIPDSDKKPGNIPLIAGALLIGSQLL